MVNHRLARRSLSPWTTLAAAGMAAMTMSCGQTSALPGTALGTYNVTGTLGTNTCGSSLNAPNPWSFTAQASEDGTTFYWEPSTGSELSSTMASSTSVSITSVETANVDTTEAGVEGPCDMTSTTAISLTLSADSPPSTLKGSITYTFAASTGASSTTDCTDQLASSGGPYETLPCTTTYTITGSRQ